MTESKNLPHVDWLLGELPRLAALGLLSPEAAEALRRYYAAQRGAAPVSRLIPLVCALLGSLLIGSGVLLLIAHNWDDLGHAVRAVLSFAPLGLATVVSAFVLARRAGSAAWREGAAVFQVLAFGASISLVSQTYHISGDFPAFLLAWLLTSLPLVYLFRSTGAALLCAIGATVRIGACAAGDTAAFLTLNWLFLALVVPHLVLLLRAGHRGAAAWLLWTLGLCLPVFLGVQAGQVKGHIWMVAFSGLFAAYSLLSIRPVFQGQGDSLWLNPLRVLGALGLAGFSLALTYKGTLREVSSLPVLSASPGLAICLLFPLAALGLAIPGRKGAVHLLAGLFPVAAAAAWALASHDRLGAALIATNGYVFAMGVAVLADGFRRDRLFHVNAGMALLAVLIVSRFFDSDLGFVVRGVADILVGIGFLAVNFLFLKQRKARAS